MCEKECLYVWVSMNVWVCLCVCLCTGVHCCLHALTSVWTSEQSAGARLLLPPWVLGLRLKPSGCHSKHFYPESPQQPTITPFYKLALFFRREKKDEASEVQLVNHWVYQDYLQECRWEVNYHNRNFLKTITPPKPTAAWMAAHKGWKPRVHWNPASGSMG